MDGGGRRRRAEHTSPLFQTPAAKFFADGVLEGHTAFLTEDYADRPGFRGEPLWRPAELSAAFLAVDAAGFKIHVHCIGDAATSEVLDALASLKSAHGQRDRRPGLTHLQYVASTDVARLAQLGVTAVVQPFLAVKDSYFFDSQLPVLGRWRAEHEYPVRGFFDAGALVASASDWPVTLPPDPLDAVQIGVTRRHPRLSLVDEPLWPEEACAAAAEDRQLHRQRGSRSVHRGRDRLHRGGQERRARRRRPRPDRAPRRDRPGEGAAHALSGRRGVSRRVSVTVLRSLCSWAVTKSVRWSTF